MGFDWEKVCKERILRRTDSAKIPICQQDIEVIFTKRKFQHIAISSSSYIFMFACYFRMRSNFWHRIIMSSALLRIKIHDVKVKRIKKYERVLPHAFSRIKMEEDNECVELLAFVLPASEGCDPDRWDLLSARNVRPVGELRHAGQVRRLQPRDPQAGMSHCW